VTLWKRQTAEANQKRSESYRKTGSVKKLNGHKKERIFAESFSGEDIKGTKKPDVLTPKYGYVSVKGAAKLQLAMYVTDRLISDLGKDHPYTKSAIAQREYYEDRHYNNGKNQDRLHAQAYKMNEELTLWLNKDNNFVKLLDYVMTNNGEVDYLADMWGTRNSYVYMTSMNDVLEAVKNSNPIAKVTPAGLRVSVSIELPSGDRRTAFSLEVRSDIKKCKSILFKAESKWFLAELIRNDKGCTKLPIDK